MRRRDAWFLLLAALLAALPGRAQVLVSGKVEAFEGEPLAGALIELLPMPGSYQAGLDALAGRTHGEPAASTITGSDGLFELAAPEPGLWVVRASAPGFVPMSAHLQPLVDEIALPSVNLRPGRPVTVVVRGPGGQAVAGALVSARSMNNELWAGQPLRGRRYWFRETNQGVADAQGRIVLHRATGETMETSSFTPGLAPARPVTGPRDRVDLSLRRGHPAVIEVSDSRGRPVPGALVTFGRDRWPAGLTDADGRLRTELPSGYTVRAVSPRGEHGVTRPQRGAETVSLVLDEQHLTQGSVIDAETRLPLAGALVWSGGTPDQLVRTDSGGRFEVPFSRQRNRDWIRAAAPGYFGDGVNPQDVPDFAAALALHPAAVASGEVVDAAGTPVVGAELSAGYIPEGSRSPTIRSRDGGAWSRQDGRFRLGGLTPGIALRLEARAAGFAPTSQRLAPLAAHENRTGLRLVLTPGASLSGRVVGGDQPVAAAQLGLVRQPQSASPMELIAGRHRGAEVAAATDDEGRFELPNLPAGSYQLSVTAAGWAPLLLPGVRVEEADDTDLGTLELPPGAAINGIVVDDGGRPIEGAEIQAEGRDSWIMSLRYRLHGRQQPQAITTADGRFVVPDRRHGERVDIHVSHDDLRPATAAAVEAPTATPLRIVLQRPARLAGMVVDASGRPVADVRIDVEVEGGYAPLSLMGNSSANPPGSTDETGRFEIERAPPGMLRVTASKKGWLNAELSGLEVPSGGELAGLRLVLEHGASVTGRVLESEGRAAIGVTVLVQESPSVYRGGYLPVATTGGDGSFVLQGVATGSRLIVAQTEDGQRAAKEIEVRPGSNAVELRFAGGVRVSGRVIDAGGAAVAGAVVALLTQDRASRLPEVRSRDDGSFALAGVPDGQYVLRASRMGYAETTLEKPLQVAGSPLSGIEIKLAAGGAIAGRLLGLEADQTALVAVVAIRDERRYSIGQVSLAGSYRIPNLAAGVWNVQATVPGGPRARGRVTLEPGVEETRLDLSFSSGLVLTGRVLRAGQAVPGVSVSLEDGWAHSTTDPEGRFRIEGLETGRYRLDVSDRRGLRHREEILVDSDREVVLEISTGRVAGRVLAADDRGPVASAGVSLVAAERIGGVVWRRQPDSGGSDFGGRFVISDLAAGDYRLQIVKEGYAPAEHRIRVASGDDPVDLEVLLEPSDGLLLVVHGPTGAPASRISYAVLDAADRVLTSGARPADENGRVRLPSVPSGSFDLLLSAPGSAVGRLRVDAGGPAVAVTLEPTCLLEVSVAMLAVEQTVATMRIIAADGKPFTALRGGAVRREWQLWFGSQTVAGLPAGDYSVEVTASDGRSWQGRVAVNPGISSRLRL